MVLAACLRWAGDIEGAPVLDHRAGGEPGHDRQGPRVLRRDLGHRLERVLDRAALGRSLPSTPATCEATWAAGCGIMDSIGAAPRAILPTHRRRLLDELLRPAEQLAEELVLVLGAENGAERLADELVGLLRVLELVLQAASKSSSYAN